MLTRSKVSLVMGFVVSFYVSMSLKDKTNQTRVSSYLLWWPGSSERLDSVLPSATPGGCGSLRSVPLPPACCAAAAPPLPPCPPPAPSSLSQPGAAAERTAWRPRRERAASSSRRPPRPAPLPGEEPGASGSPRSPWTSRTGRGRRQGGLPRAAALWLCVCLRRGRWRRWPRVSERWRKMREGGVLTGTGCGAVEGQTSVSLLKAAEWQQMVNGAHTHRQKIKTITLSNRRRRPDSVHFLSIKGQPISAASCSAHLKAMPKQN